MAGEVTEREMGGMCQFLTHASQQKAHYSITSSARPSSIGVQRMHR
jgi:hypothetical protein